MFQKLPYFQKNPAFYFLKQTFVRAFFPTIVFSLHGAILEMKILVFQVQIFISLQNLLTSSHEYAIWWRNRENSGLYADTQQVVFRNLWSWIFGTIFRAEISPNFGIIWNIKKQVKTVIKRTWKWYEKHITGIYIVWSNYWQKMKTIWHCS